ncbi:MAG: YjdF family protein [Streptococcaceae bacterium]|jgi:hypothetical protein|nr:YjdF family protein [Streptococcaceae bacterium]
MSNLQISLTVFFKDPFWVGIFEKTDKGKLSVSKVTFGAEPKDFQIYEFILQHYYGLVFGPSIECCSKQKSPANPKRLQREAQKKLNRIGVGTKAQQALKLMQEQSRNAHKVRSKAQKDAKKLKQFEFKQAKRREKHKGH